jgi:hypothetical protein
MLIAPDVLEILEVEDRSLIAGRGCVRREDDICAAPSGDRRQLPREIAKPTGLRDVNDTDTLRNGIDV